MKKIVNYLVQLSKKYNLEIMVGSTSVSIELFSAKSYLNRVECLYNDFVSSFPEFKSVDI